MSAQDFGLALQACRNSTSHNMLAQCMFPAFRPSVTVAPLLTSQQLEQHLQEIEAGHVWPFGRSDLKSFVSGVLNCLRRRPSPHVEYDFKQAAAIYFTELGFVTP